jgi:hypothetical protein
MAEIGGSIAAGIAKSLTQQAQLRIHKLYKEHYNEEQARAILLAVTWQIREDTDALRLVDFKTSCDIMKSWTSFQEILIGRSYRLGESTGVARNAVASLISKDDLKSLKEHSRRAINAVSDPKDKMIAIGMLIHATYHLGILSAAKQDRKMKECMKQGKELAQQVFRQYIGDFHALQSAAQDELQPQFRGLFANKQVRRNLLMQFASLGHMVYLLPPNTPAGNQYHPRFPFLEQATMKVMRKLRSKGFATARILAYPLDTQPPCYGTFEGHTSTVFCCDIFDDPGHIKCVSGSYDTTLKLWDVTTGRCYRTLRGHAAAINCCAVIHQTRQLVSGSADGTLRIWNLSDGTLARTLIGHGDWVYSVLVFENDNGTRIASGSWDRSKLRKGQQVVFQSYVCRAHDVGLLIRSLFLFICSHQDLGCRDGSGYEDVGGAYIPCIRPGDLPTGMEIVQRVVGPYHQSLELGHR